MKLEPTVRLINYLFIFHFILCYWWL